MTDQQQRDVLDHTFKVRPLGSLSSEFANLVDYSNSRTFAASPPSDLSLPGTFLALVEQWNKD